MAGYIGSKAVNLSTTGADINGDANIDGDLSFRDNDKAIFGAGSDLQIYHDGSNSYIVDNGTGDLLIRAENNLYLKRTNSDETYLSGAVNGAVTLFHNNNPKIATSITGVDITGTLTSDGLTFGAEGQKIEFFTSSAPRPFITSGDTYQTNGLDIDSDNGITLKYDNNDNGAGGVLIKRDSTNKSVFLADSNGDISFYEDTGTTPKFFWDASAESLGIGGTTSVTTAVTGDNVAPKLIVEGTTATSIAVLRQDTSIVSGNSLGSLGFYGTDTTSNTPTPLAGIQALASGTHAAGDNPTDLRFLTTPDGSSTMAERMRISGGNVGIGASSVDSLLHLQKSDATAYSATATDGQVGVGPTIYLENPANANSTVGGQIVFGMRSTEEQARIGATGGTAPALTFGTGDAERMRITSSGIMEFNTNAVISVNDTAGAMYIGGGGTLPNTIQNQASVLHNWQVAGSNAMRLDASGKLLVGKTSDDNTATGLVVNGNGFTKIVRSSGTANVNSVLQLNRLSSDGDIAVFQKDGSTVGSIGTTGSLYVAGTNSGIKFYSAGFHAVNTSGTAIDNSEDVGAANVRWDDVYATNGTIQTSDRNEKQDIAELTDAEQRVAVAAKGLLRKFRWRDAVEAKGDDARTHFGIIAQDLQAAFAAEGLDAGDYAMFISSTWTDENTGEERTRMGVRYSELLAFIIGAL